MSLVTCFHLVKALQVQTLRQNLVILLTAEENDIHRTAFYCKVRRRAIVKSTRRVSLFHV